MDHLIPLQDLMMEQYANPFAGEVCGCGRGLRLVKCHDCFQYPASCRQCFMDTHHRTPFHWALTWDSEKGHARKQDYSAVWSDEASIQLGHVDDKRHCRGAQSNCFIIVHTNGVHSTKLRFCECLNAPDRITQLMRARLFPATTSKPETAFSFAMLKDFSMHNIQSKCGAFDFMLSLRRLSDNVFPDKISVSTFYASVDKSQLIKDFRIPINPSYALPGFGSS